VYPGGEHSTGKLPKHASGVYRRNCDVFGEKEQLRKEEAGTWRTEKYDIASTGPWTAKDPVGFVTGLTNLYEYTNGDPANYGDPSGTFVPLAGGIIAAGAVAGGIFGGLAAALDPCRGGLLDILSGVGQGALAGAVGSGVALAAGGLGAGAVGAGFLGGVAGGAVGQAFAGDFDPVTLGLSGVFGAFSGGAASRWGPQLIGRRPNLWAPRTLRDYGPNSLRLIRQEGIGGGVGGPLEILREEAQERFGGSECCAR
jgi:RHS repeat-associated protein